MAHDRNGTFNARTTALDLAAMRALATPEINDLSELTSSLKRLTSFAWRSFGERAVINPGLLGNLGRAVTTMRTARSFAGPELR
ncbi:hypothetical protein [Bosea sp. BK604]|uniref:hypothetical protein n=1 Tax=Bosea sp. BK604 TaxID=2512180 RepID=UPI001053AF99|nr:hypothetical protein [Bosea sp. BK604]TCR64732.1 hypothetical protein EV560_106198 [Bosea sp. BK604]